MSKQLASLGNGAIVLSEDAGNFSLAISEQAAVGGGAAAGVLSVQGSGTIVLKGKLAFDLAMALLEAHSPAPLVALEQGAQAIADAAIDKA